MWLHHPHHSVRTALSLLIGIMGLLLVFQASSGFYRSYQRHLVTRRMVLLNLDNVPIFASLSSARLGTGLAGDALLAEAPATEATFAQIKANRRMVDEYHDEAMQKLQDLDLPGIAPLLTNLRSAHDAVLVARRAADAALHLPRAQRDPIVVVNLTSSIDELQKNILAIDTFLENSVRLTDPLIDHYIAIRWAARTMRGAAGSLLARVESALDSGRPWTRADLAGAASDRVATDFAWKTLADAAALPDAPEPLINATNQVKTGYFGYIGGEPRALMDALRTGRVPQISGADLKARAAPALLSIAQLTDAITQAIVARTAKQNKEATRGLIWNAILLAAALSLTALGWLIGHWRISRPLQQLRIAMSDLAQAKSARDIAPDLQSAHRQDEVGEMSRALGVFHSEMIRAEELAELTDAQRRAEAETAARVAAELAGMAERQGEVVETMVFGLMQLAEGNLAFTLAVPLAPEYEALRALFNDAVQGLRSTVRDVLLRAQTIGRGTGDIARAAEDLAQRTQVQASRLEQAAAALAQLTATVGQTAPGSARAQSLAASAKNEAEGSGEVVRQTVAAMEQIEGSARQIGQVITLIDEIAFQTNLLALNAGVEAVRAGDSGRGFAVIASEVRALAQRAARAASEITGLIHSSMQHVERGVHLVGETGEALGRIQQGVVKIDVAITEIAASAQTQSNGLAEVNANVKQMDHVTQQNAAMVEQSTAATRALAQETTELSRAVQHFTIETPKTLADAA